MSESLSVVDHIVAELAATGVGHIFGVDGANIEDLYDTAHHRPDITAVLAKHEFGAATMADGYSRSGGRLGVVAATSGGGALNLIAGLGESLASRVPVLALVGQAPAAMDGRGSFQDTSGRGGSLNAHALFAAVSVFCERVLAPDDIVAALPRALAAARRGGPAVLLIPKDVQQGIVTIAPERSDADSGEAAGPADSPDLIVRALRDAQGPITIIAGDQVARDDARSELEELRALLRARVVCVPDAKDVAVAPGSGSWAALGVCGVMGHPSVAGALAEGALCLMVGTRLPATARAGLDEVLGTLRTVSIGSEPPFIPCTHVHAVNLRTTLRDIRTALTHADQPPFIPEPATAAPTALNPPVYAGPGVRYRDAMDVLDRTLPDGADIVVDAGNTGAAAIHYLPARRDGRFLVALGMGGMGYSFGAGIGVAFGRGRRTVVIAGDGSFFMHGMEIHTAVQYGLPILFILCNNNAHAMCVTREQLYYGGAYSYNRFGPSNLGAGLASMFPGLHAVDVSDADDLRTAVALALNLDGPSVISVECSADEIPPFAPFLSDTTSVKTAAPVRHNGALANNREDRPDVATSTH